VAIYGFFAFPDTPSSTRAWWLTEEEKQLSISRLPQVEKHRGVIGWNIVSRVLGTWHFWAFVMIWIFASNTEMFSTNAIMNLWLSDTGNWTVQQANYIPMGVAGVGIAATLFLGWYTDFTKLAWHVGVILGLTAIISGAVMLSPPSDGAKFFALFLNGCQYASQTVMFAWANDLTRSDDAKRAVILGAMNTFSTAVYMFWSILFYNATQSPDWHEGSIAMICMGVAFFITTLVCYFLERRDKRRQHTGAVDRDASLAGNGKKAAPATTGANCSKS
jgi:ACS family pantothenate transporter-like MFS transporter